MTENSRPPTIGEFRVRVSFNPSGNVTVDTIKEATAALIDTCQTLMEEGSDERARCAALAQSAYEEAAMWAVKAATSA